MKKYLVTLCDLSVTILIIFWINTLYPLFFFKDFTLSYHLTLPVLLTIVALLFGFIFLLNIKTARACGITEKRAVLRTVLNLIVIIFIVFFLKS